MKTNSKKLCSLVLASSMALSMAVPAFAAERSYEKEITFTVTQGSEAEPFANRFDHVTVKGEEHFLFEEHKENGQYVTERFIVDGINGAINCASESFQQFWTPIKLGQLALNTLIFDAHGIGSAIDFKYYSRTDVRYQINSITGKRTPISTTYTLICKMYGNGDVKTYEWHKQSK